jgi:hypothetical protein
MDPAILSAVSVLAGPLIDGGWTFVASWLALRGQLRFNPLPSVSTAKKLSLILLYTGRNPATFKRA